MINTLNTISKGFFISKTQYTLKQILEAISKTNSTSTRKRLIFDKTPLGGFGNRWLIGFFILIPLIEYALIFNDYVFPMLGIAQAIVIFVVMLSMVMLLIFTLVVLNNSSVTNRVKSSWNSYFPYIEFELLTTTGATPYKEFFNYYHEITTRSPNEEEVKSHLELKFKQMQEENNDLIEAMTRDKSRNK